MGVAALGAEPSTVKWISACSWSTDNVTACVPTNVPAVGANETLSDPGPDEEPELLEQPKRSALTLSRSRASPRACQRLTM
jgi:hypothetical protein